jgi:uncharacterized oxidoreductase
MQPTGNTILITGGGSGIGKGLAESFHRLGNQVIISGRRKQALDETTATNPGMQSMIFDVTNPAKIRTFAQEVARRHPQLNVLINNAGVMRVERLSAQPEDLADAESIIATNLLGPIRLTAALLPVLRGQPQSTIINVSSGLAFVPLVITPTYCATKAAIHSYTQSLRTQLAGTTTEVLELIPPYVATDLLDGATDPRAMALKDFIAETMAIFQTQPTVPEICVERVKRLRLAAENGNYNEIFRTMNEAWVQRYAQAPV